VKRQVEALQGASFEDGSEINKYYEMLPDDSPLKKNMLRCRQHLTHQKE